MRTTCLGKGNFGFRDVYLKKLFQTNAKDYPPTEHPDGEGGTILSANSKLCIEKKSLEGMLHSQVQEKSPYILLGLNKMLAKWM